MLTITIDDLLKKISDTDDINKIKEAYQLLVRVFQDDKRRNGDTIVYHHLKVTETIINLDVDSTTIISSLLHEVLDKDISLKDEIIASFGSDVYKIVKSLSTINHLEMPLDTEDDAINLRKIVVGLCDDVRVLIIKLADRLHNMQTMAIFSQEHQKKVANDTLNVLVPIAHRLGINSIKSELENLCLLTLKPDVYQDILNKLNDTVSDLNIYLEQMQKKITDILNENGIKFEIKGRVKSIYSIYNKLSSGKKWENIYDILALRIFVQQESDCYAVLGLLHSRFKPVPHRFKDYIAVPKQNMYQSLHTTVFGFGGRYFEIQIRTYEMDEIAEKGIASHWSYKEKGTKKIQNLMEQKLELYRAIIENYNNEADDSGILNENLLSDQIYVFTPKGDVIELPKNSTPIDFAYRIHSNVGNKTVGAIVNDKMVPLDTTLKDNDVVKIMTQSTATPNKDWLNFVQTSQAKNNIKSYFSKIAKDEYIQKGRVLLEREIRKRKLSISELLNKDNVNILCHDLKLNDLDDIYVSIGSFRYTASYIINYLVNDNPINSLVIRNNSSSSSNNLDIIVDGKTNILTHIARCCNPVKGDEIVGVITRNEGISIHRKDCSNATANLLDVYWNNQSNNKYIVKLFIYITNDVNILSNLITVISSENAKLLKLDTQNEGILISIEVNNKIQIDNLIVKITNLKYVKEVKRL